MRPWFCLVTTLAACSSPSPERISAVEQGRAVFQTPKSGFSCATCHAVEATGLLLPGAPLAGVTERPSFWGRQENDLLRAVNQCRVVFQLVPELRAEEPEAARLYAYLESLPGDAEPWPFTVVQEVAELPGGDAEAGGETYRAACAGCHEALGDDVPRLPDDALARHAHYSAAEQRLVFVEKARHGAFLGYGGRMPPFSAEALSDAQLADVLAYLDL